MNATVGMIIPTLVRQEQAVALAECALRLEPRLRQVLIINNGAKPLPAQPGIEIMSPGTNLGVAASWNLGLRRLIDHDVVIVSNDDITLGSQSLDVLIQELLEPQRADTLIVGPATHPFSLFAMRPAEALDVVGEFDEQFWPAYYEDDDYRYRMRLQKRALVQLDDALIGHQHVSHGTAKALDEAGKAWLARCYQRCFRLYHAKWGGFPPHEVFRTPYEYKL